MLSAFISLFISLSIGLVAYLITRRSNGPTKISGREILIGSAVCFGVLFTTNPLIENAIINYKTQYFEYYNGYEVEAVDKSITCERDGDCKFTYDCDPYLATETYTTTDEDGDVHYHTRVVTKYHDCPYVKTEHEYKVVTTLGDYPVGGRFIDEKAEKWRDEDISSDIPVGPPLFWLEARARIAAGLNGGVTKLHPYKNYLLASDKTILDAYSKDIEDYLDSGLLPDHTSKFEDPIYSYYLSDKFQLVKVNSDSKAWNESLSRLNGYFGKELQGDVHMVAIDANVVGDKDRYAQSLFAYWKSDHFKKYALPKNSIGIVVGVKDGVVVWSRATGGLPVGNEGLINDLQTKLAGTKFDPNELIGTPHKSGVLQALLWGEHKFQRPCMECVEENQDGYKYLKADIYVTGGQRLAIVVISSLLAAGMWYGFLASDDRYR